MKPMIRIQYNGFVHLESPKQPRRKWVTALYKRVVCGLDIPDVTADMVTQQAVTCELCKKAE
jgi:hypothetical protein